MEPSDALFSALLYSNLFHFPLTREELIKRAIGRTVEAHDVDVMLSLHIQVKTVGEYIAFSQKDCEIRRKRESISNQKHKQALVLSKKLSLIPPLRFIGISGSVAAMNADWNDDIDLFLIVAPGTLWVSRFLVLLLLSIFGARGKRPGQTMVCLNMLLTTDNLPIPPHSQDIYTAYELFQLTPLYDSGNTYRYLMKKNIWAQVLLPGMCEKSVPLQRTRHNRLGIFLIPFEQLFRAIQIKHLRKLGGSYDELRGVLTFHTHGTRTRILASFRQELTTNHLDKVVAFLYTRKRL